MKTLQKWKQKFLNFLNLTTKNIKFAPMKVDYNKEPIQKLQATNKENDTCSPFL